MSALALSRRDEAWRYSDLDAAAGLWPPVCEAIALYAGEQREAALFADDGVREFAITLAPGARYRFNLFNTAERLGRVGFDVTLHAGAVFDLNVVQVAGGDATVEAVTTLRHVEAGATSRQMVRSVLGGRATGNYLGKVAVARGADGTDAGQSVRAMLLTRGATANAKPELEIFADDVKCAHGAAVGELDAAALFYLAARGLPPAEAKRLLLTGFVAEVFAGAAEEEALFAAAMTALERVV